MTDTQVIAAVKDGDVAALDRLLGNGADVNERDEHGWTPLNWAAGKGDAKLVAQLIDRGADVTLTGRDNRTALMIAKAADRSEVVEMLTGVEQARGVWKDPRDSRRYCKAYLVSQLRPSAEWQPSGDVLDDDIVYLHQDFTVTRSMWHGEDVLLDAVTAEWREFCEGTLAFAIPADLL
jgi:hypothetical protein